MHVVLMESEKGEAAHVQKTIDIASLNPCLTAY